VSMEEEGVERLRSGDEVGKGEGDARRGREGITKITRTRNTRFLRTYIVFLRHARIASHRSRFSRV
jgi:hypothetical protein